MANKRILLGVTGGIAAYKSAELSRLLIKAGFDVRVVMTSGAKAFIQPLTFQALTGYPVRESLLDEQAEAGMGHIELARWADLILIAPATADFIARLSSGFANDLLTTLCLATASPIAIAPAMNQQMWLKNVTQKNIAELADYNSEQPTIIWGPAEGNQACGDVGPGRMLEPAELASSVCQLFAISEDKESSEPPELPLKGRRVLLTAGPTREALDPVRYISNHSSGKMGYALAAAAVKLGADVVMVSGPVALGVPVGVDCIGVASAQEMYGEVMSRVDRADVFIATAAVADYRPQSVADQKIKKSQEEMVIRLTRNPDIVSSVAASQPRPFTVGFAAETNDVIGYARDKLQRKSLDLIIANDVSRSDIGFNSDNNEAVAIWTDGELSLGMASKSEIAERILAVICERLS